METYKLKIKLGQHEFEAEGPVDVVQAQFNAFKELIPGTPSKPVAEVAQNENEEKPLMNHQPLERILKADGRVISLTAKCETIDEAVLLILLGQKEMRANQEVTGSEIMDGLAQSGYKLRRVDTVMNKLGTDGSTITMGIHRGRRYRLSNSGLAKALNVAKEVIATVP
jgi:hypothetical protein